MFLKMYTGFYTISMYILLHQITSSKHLVCIISITLLHFLILKHQVTKLTFSSTLFHERDSPSELVINDFNSLDTIKLAHGYTFRLYSSLLARSLISLFCHPLILFHSCGLKGSCIILLHKNGINQLLAQFFIMHLEFSSQMSTRLNHNLFVRIMCTLYLFLLHCIPSKYILQRHLIRLFALKILVGRGIG